MDILVFGLLAIVFFVMAALNKQHKLVGLVAGLGLVVTALMLQTSGMQIQTGINTTVYTATNSSTVTYLYSDVDSGSGMEIFKTALTIILGAAGLLVLLNSVTSVKL